MAIIFGKHFCAWIEDRGFRETKMVEILDNEGKGSIQIRVDESRI